MANFQKFTKAQISNILKHIERKNKEYSNKNIDKEKTKDNYSLIEREDVTKYINERIEQSQHLTRANIVHLVAFSITIPKDYDGDEKEFLRNTVNFFKEDMGKENIAYAEVHKDEKSVHMHLGIIPITGDNRLCAKDIINRTYLINFHDRLQTYLREKDPQHTINIVREEREKEKNLPMREYKLKQELKEIEEKEKQLQERQKNYTQTRDYNNLIDKYCNDKDISIHQYYRDVFMYDRDYPTSYGIPIPEAINPERSREEQQQIIEHYKEEQEQQREQEHTHERR